MGKLSVLFLQSEHNLNAEYKEELQSVVETLKQLGETRELELAPESQSSPAPVGGRDLALQSRRDIRLVKGAIEFQCMDLKKVKKAWASQFCQCAEEDMPLSEKKCVGYLHSFYFPPNSHQSFPLN